MELVIDWGSWVVWSVVALGSVGAVVGICALIWLVLDYGYEEGWWKIIIPAILVFVVMLVAGIISGAVRIG